MSDTLRVSNLHFGLNTSNYNQPQIGFTSVGIGSTANYGFLQFFGTSKTLCWTANGTVGIGTTNPGSTMEIYTNSGVGGTTQLNVTSVAGTPTTTNTSVLNLRIQGAGGGMVDNSISAQYNSSGVGTYSLAFKPFGTTAMTILGTGNVGIGTTTVNYPLQIGTAGSIIRIGGLINEGSAANTTVYGLERSRNQIQFSGYRDVIPDKIGAKIVAINKQTYAGTTLRHLIQSTDLAFFTVPPDTNDLDNTVERLRITDTGNVGIGTAAPTSLLQVSGEVAVNSLKMNAGGTAFQIARGKIAGGTSSGSVVFPFTFTNTPSVCCTFETSSTTQLFSASVSAVSTTGFNYVKTWNQTSGAAGGAATGEPVFWIAIG